MKTPRFSLIALTAALAGVIGLVACEPTPPPAFRATFDAPSDFYDRFEFGVSGIDPTRTPGTSGMHTYHGDHNESCEAPTTQRTVNLDRSLNEMFWYCAPGGDSARGHMMTGVNTLGYNIAWFSPKGYFTNIQSVCFDLNLTNTPDRKWVDVLFVGPEDAERYPVGSVTHGGQAVARGTGASDLGFTDPDFRDNDPNTGILPRSGDLAGLKITVGSKFHWFQDQSRWVARDQAWPWFNTENPATRLLTDKAERFTHCLVQHPGKVTILQEVPDGLGIGAGDGNNDLRVIDIPGAQIPQGPVRVVFSDDNYDPPKSFDYNPDNLTWHWDNITITEKANPGS